MSLERTRKTVKRNASRKTITAALTFLSLFGSYSLAKTIDHSSTYSEYLQHFNTTPSTPATIHNDLHSDNTFQQLDSDLKISLRAKLAVKNRYRYNDIASMASTYSTDQSFDILLQLWQIVTYYYYHDIEQDTLVDNIISELLAVVNDSEIRNNYHLSEENAEKLISFINKQRQLIQKDSSLEYSDLESYLRKISDYCQSSSGIYASWPVIETIFSISGTLDNYSNIILSDKYSDMLGQLKGNYSGIGTDLIFDPADYPFVFDVIPESPADICGIKPGDSLVEINSHELKDISSNDFDIIFDKCESFTLSVKRNDEIFKTEVKKTQLTSSTIRNAGIFPDSHCGYIRITSFNKDTFNDFSSELSKLDGKISSLIIDLRNNGGGLVTSAVESADLFLSEGKIVSIKSFTSEKHYFARPDNNSFENMPVCILVNDHTASAAEIFTAALKQNDRAIVIGKTTFGKALVQTVYDLRHNAGALVLTTAEYLPPSDKSFNLKGITPNIEVVNTENADKNGTHLSIIDRISCNNAVMKTALKCLNN